MGAEEWMPILVLGTLVFLQRGCLAQEDTIVDILNKHNKFVQIASKISRYNLTSLHEQEDITVFVPTTTAFHFYSPPDYGYSWASNDSARAILLYHVVKGRVSTSDMSDYQQLPTYHPYGNSSLFVNIFRQGDFQVYTINGAQIITANIRASNGIIHVIDRVISPLQTTKTVADFLTAPDQPNLAFKSILLASVVDYELRNATNSTEYQFTVFAPNDSFIMTMPEYGKDILFADALLIKKVFHAHVIPNKIICMPEVGYIPEQRALEGTLKFTRQGKKLYVTNNGVRAHVVKTNIPVSNGVVHVIDDLLFFIYMNITDKLSQLPDTSACRYRLSQISSDLRTTIEDPNKKKTLFVPVNEAFTKIPATVQQNLSDVAFLDKIVEGHVILDLELDSNALLHGLKFLTASGQNISIYTSNGETFVEGGGVRAQIIVMDIGCTNGIIHLISNVLFLNNFTVWEAIKGNTQLLEMTLFIQQHEQLRLILSSTNSSHEPVTVFMTGDTALAGIHAPILNGLKNNSVQLLEAVRGEIAEQVELGSSEVVDSVEVGTIGGQKLQIQNEKKALVVFGSNVRAHVILQDIWCSNGVLHIVDNILHIPTKTIVEEIRTRSELSVISSILKALGDVSRQLNSTAKSYTFFVPSDAAFTDMPTDRAHIISKNPELLPPIIKSHIVENDVKFVEDYHQFESLKAQEGSLYVVKEENKVYVINNNVRGQVTTGNVRAVNGIIHIVDTMLHFPYKTVADTIEQHTDLSSFHSLMSKVDEYRNWTTLLGIEQTIFAPSNQFMEQVPPARMASISADPHTLQQIFFSHVFPDVNFNSTYLDRKLNGRSSYKAAGQNNTLFTLRKQMTNQREYLTVDIGYPNLAQRIDLVLDGIACSNGIIYVVHQFLNYPIHNVRQEMRRPNTSIGADLLLKLIPRNSTVNLESDDDQYTVFVPADIALSHFSFQDISYINDNITHTEKLEVIQRHIIKGKKVKYQNLKTDLSDYSSTSHVTFIEKSDGIYLKWKEKEAKIIQHDIIATNGIAHVIDIMFVSTPYQTTTTAPTTTVKSKNKNTSGGVHLFQSFETLLLVILTLFFVAR